MQDHQDDNYIKIKCDGDVYLGSNLSISFELDESLIVSNLKQSPKDLKKKITLKTEWMIIEPETLQMIKMIKGNNLYLNEDLFQKKLKIYSIPIVEGEKYFGMPFQKDLGIIELQIQKLGQILEKKDESENEEIDDEVEKIYRYFAQNLKEYRDDLQEKYKYKFPLQILNFLYKNYKDKIKLESLSKKVKTLEEEKNYWKSNFERQKKELQKNGNLLGTLSQENKEIKEKIDSLLEEKNFFMNSKFFKNTSDISFFDEKSHEFNQSKLVGFGGNSIQPIPQLQSINDNNILEMTLLENEENNKREYLEERQEKEEKLDSLQNLLKNYRKELDYYKKIYSQNKIDFIINENNGLKVKVKSLENQLKQYKSKLMKFDFAYKYISKEFNNLKSFSKMFTTVEDNNENFLMASNVIKKLTQELYVKNTKILELDTMINKLKNDLDHNRTFQISQLNFLELVLKR